MKQVWTQVIAAALAVALTGCGAWRRFTEARTRMPEPECIHVAPDGSDDHRGSRRRPLATLVAALEAARKLQPATPRCIVLHEGDYFLDEPLELDEHDAGLTLRSRPGDEVTVYGGRRVTGWRRDGDRFWAADLPGVQEGAWDFRMLSVNGRFAPRARLPKQGHFTHLSTFTVPWMSTTGGGWKRKPTHAERTTMVYRPDDLGPWLDLRNAELTVYHMWDESTVGLEALDPKTHTATFANPAGHPPGAFGVRKYVVWNVREGMTEPGQWYLDRTRGRLVYWPLADEDMARAKVVAPVVESIVRIEGQVYAPAREIVVRDLRLAVTNTPLVAGGFGANRFAGAVQMRCTDGCQLVNLEIANVGGQGVKAHDCRRLRVERSHVHHTGACGIKIDGAEAVVADCRIHHVGRTYPSAIALWGGGRYEQGLAFLHNHIHDVPYSAIACGGDHHRIEGNLIERAMQTLHDGAGIYITFCRKVVLRGNFIRDVADTGGYGASAYYLDEQATDCLVERNLALRVPRPSHNHMARRNTLRHNVFIVTGDATLTFPKSAAYRLEGNVIRATGKVTFTHPQAIETFAGNVVFSGTGQVVGQTLRDYRATDAGPLDPGETSVLAEPQLVEYETGRVRFAPTSPALQLGIPPLDVSDAGPRP